MYSLIPLPAWLPACDLFCNDRDNFLIDGEGRTFCWEFLSDLLKDMAGEGDVQAASKMDRNSRYPPAAAMLNLVSDQKPNGRHHHIIVF